MCQTFADNGIVDYAYCNPLPYQIASLGLLLYKYFGKYIEVLNLTRCCIGDYGLWMLHRYLCRSNQQVNILNLGGNSLTAASSSFICDLISSAKPHSLELSCNYLKDTGIYDVCAAVAENKSIKELYLASNEITYLGSVSLSDTMAHVLILIVSHNCICDDGAEVLSQGLMHSMTLKHLAVAHCNIGAVGAGELARALTVNSSLEILWMNGNAIGHCGATEFAVALCINDTLKELSLTGDSTIDHSAVSKILVGLHQNDSLITLDFPADLEASSKDLLKSKIYNINANRSHNDHQPVTVLFCDDFSGSIS